MATNLICLKAKPQELYYKKAVISTIHSDGNQHI